MCEACAAECKMIGDVVPGLALVLATKTTNHTKAGDYGLVRSNGPDVVFSVKPWPDPADGLSDAEVNKLGRKAWASCGRWFADVEVFEKACQGQLDLSTAVDIGFMCRDAGWDRERDGKLECWLFHRMGVTLRDNPLPAPRTIIRRGGRKPKAAPV